MSRLFVLGAADPEMAAIEKILCDVGETVAYATVSGKRCHPGNAYKADGVIMPSGSGARLADEVVLVECDFPVLPPFLTPCASCGDIPDPTFVGLGICDHGTPGGMGGCGDHHRWSSPVIVRIDHHRPGDTGTGCRQSGTPRQRASHRFGGFCTTHLWSRWMTSTCRVQTGD